MLTTHFQACLVYAGFNIIAINTFYSRGNNNAQPTGENSQKHMITNIPGRDRVVYSTLDFSACCVTHSK